MAGEALRAPSGVCMRRASEAQVPVPPTATACQGDGNQRAVSKTPDLSEPEALEAICQNTQAFLHELRYLAAWYNRHRPDMTLGGRTPDEVYHRLRPMNRQPRFERRANWPRRSPCAKPATLDEGKPGVRLASEITFQGKRRHLPLVTLKRAA